MNFSIYIPDHLGIKLNKLSAQRQMSKNAMVREALEHWIKTNSSKQWQPGFFSFEVINKVPDFKAYRSELKAPPEDVL